MKRCLLLLFLGLLCLTGPSFARSSELLIDTASGPVLGFLLPELSLAPTEQVGVIEAWRGIPYGRPPLGDLRWAAPQPVAPWTTPLPAWNFGPECMQPDGSGSEDCLFLNVYRKPVNRSSSSSSNNEGGLRPVLFYIHGGGLTGGAGSNNDFSRFVAESSGEGVVVVQLNYRLNLFGFLAVEQLADVQDGVCGNYGIQDQLLALEWTQTNIKAFGGDPSRVTIAGQSSGGTSVFALLSSPRSKGLFSGAISLSGSPNITMTLHAGMQQNAPIVEKSGCVRASSNDTVACLRGLPASAIVPALYPDAWNTPGIWGMPTDPTGKHYQGLVLVDGVTVVSSFSSALQKAVIDVPLMFGNMGQEPDEWPDQHVEDYSLQEWQAFLDGSFKAWGSDVASSMNSLYSAQAKVNPQLAYDSIVSDYGLSCASIALSQTAKAPIGQYQSPIYVFVNDWAPQYPHNTTDTYTSRWAYHCCDLNMMTQSWQDLGGSTYRPGPVDIEGASFLSSLWYNFLANRDPGFGWVSVEKTAAWPNSWATFHIYPNQSAIVENFKSDVYSYYQQIGLADPTFWWCN